MVIEILNGGEILVNCKFKLNKIVVLNLYRKIPRSLNPNLVSTLNREIPRNLIFSILTSWLKSPHHSGFRLPFNSVFRVSSSTERAVAVFGPKILQVCYAGTRHLFHVHDWLRSSVHSRFVPPTREQGWKGAYFRCTSWMTTWLQQAFRAGAVSLWWSSCCPFFLGKFLWHNFHNLVLLQDPFVVLSIFCPSVCISCLPSLYLSLYFPLLFGKIWGGKTWHGVRLRFQDAMSPLCLRLPTQYHRYISDSPPHILRGLQISKILVPGRPLQ